MSHMFGTLSQSHTTAMVLGAGVSGSAQLLNGGVLRSARKLQSLVSPSTEDFYAPVACWEGPNRYALSTQCASSGTSADRGTLYQRHFPGGPVGAQPSAEDACLYIAGHKLKYFASAPLALRSPAVQLLAEGQHQRQSREGLSDRRSSRHPSSPSPCSPSADVNTASRTTCIGAPAKSCSPAASPLPIPARPSVAPWRRWEGRGAALSQLQRTQHYQTLTPALEADIKAAAAKKQTGVSLKYLLDFGTQPLERQMLLSARFLHAEFPVRLAHRLMDLNHLPPKLSNEPHVKRVKGWYGESFADFRAFPAIKDNVDVVKFTAMLRNAFRRHNNVVPAIAKGVEVYKRELERTGESTQERESEIQHFLDTFFLSRIAIRFLAGHHISMFEPPRPEHIGLVHTRCSPFLVASEAVAEARAICFREYGGAPNVTVLGNKDLTMAYVPSHLHHMVFELVKNSLRAVQERYGDSDDEPPPIQVVVAEGLEDVTIKVSDQGGGIPRSGLQRIWTYLYTTARSPLPEVDIDTSNMPAVLAGYGCGLPLSRLYARYFGGDLQMISMEGYGTDAYLHLARLGNDEEPLPGAV